MYRIEKEIPSGQLPVYRWVYLPSQPSKTGDKIAVSGRWGIDGKA
jgi:hypothetical protein